MADVQQTLSLKLDAIDDTAKGLDSAAARAERFKKRADLSATIGSARMSARSQIAKSDVAFAKEQDAVQQRLRENLDAITTQQLRLAKLSRDQNITEKEKVRIHRDLKDLAAARVRLEKSAAIAARDAGLAARRAAIDQFDGDLGKSGVGANKKAQRAAKEFELTRKLRLERQKMLGILTSEHSTSRQRVAAQRRINDLVKREAKLRKLAKQEVKEQQMMQKSRLNSNRIGAFGGGLFAAVGTTAAAAKAIELGARQDRVERRLEAVLKSTGGKSGFTGQQLKDRAAQLQQRTTFGDEEIISAQSQLATFTKIRGQVFDDTIVAALNMSTVIDQDVKSSVIQLGKALNDPIAGLTALRRVGVSFSEEQQQQIRILVESGDVMEAQKVILRELKTEFGGAAEAVAKGDFGKITQMKNDLGDIAEIAGTNLAASINDLIDKTKEFSGIGKMSFTDILDGGQRLRKHLEAQEAKLAALRAENKIAEREILAIMEKQNVSRKEAIGIRMDGINAGKRAKQEEEKTGNVLEHINSLIGRRLGQLDADELKRQNSLDSTESLLHIETRLADLRGKANPEQLKFLDKMVDRLQRIKVLNEEAVNKQKEIANAKALNSLLAIRIAALRDQARLSRAQGDEGAAVVKDSQAAALEAQRRFADRRNQIAGMVDDQGLQKSTRDRARKELDDLDRNRSKVIDAYRQESLERRQKDLDQNRVSAVEAIRDAEQQILEAKARAGDKAAKSELERLQITERYRMLREKIREGLTKDGLGAGAKDKLENLLARLKASERSELDELGKPSGQQKRSGIAAILANPRFLGLASAYAAGRDPATMTAQNTKRTADAAERQANALEGLLQGNGLNGNFNVGAGL